MRKCKDCGSSLILGENWTENKKKKSDYICAECSKLYRAGWYQKNNESVRARALEYHYNRTDEQKDNDRERLKLYMRKKRSEKKKEVQDRLDKLPFITKNYTERDKWLFLKYGIRERDFSAILKSQGGGCAICGEPEGDSHHHVDHDHAKEYMDIRGILCGPCNRGIGMFKDSPEFMQEGSRYLGGTE